MTTFEKATELAGRVLIASMFLIAGLGKIGGYAGTQGYMQSQGVPGALLPLVIALEVLGAIAIVIGYRTRLVAAALAVFCYRGCAGIPSAAQTRCRRSCFMKDIRDRRRLPAARRARRGRLVARCAHRARTAPGELLRGA